MEMGHVLQEMLVRFLVLYVFYFVKLGELNARKGSKTKHAIKNTVCLQSWGS